MKKKLKLLLVEDSKPDAVLCEAILKHRLGRPFKMDHVTCLGAAISEMNYEDQNYDLVLLDLNLKDSSGIPTLQVFKKYCENTPVIVLSGMSDEKIIDTALNEEGAASYIVKGEYNPEFMIKEIGDIIFPEDEKQKHNKKNIFGYKIA